MTFKEFLLKIYYAPLLSKERTDKNQQAIRNKEWEAIKTHIKAGEFLDVGCGAGYSMKMAREMGCVVTGIDPEPGAHGVGRYDSEFTNALNIVQGFSEKLPFANNSFDTVYSSHVLEHVNSVEQSLEEMKRVLKPDGVLIIGVPSSTMAKINLFTQYAFFTHQRIVNALLGRFIATGSGTFKEILLPPSHSHQGESIYFDMEYYQPENWRKMIAGVFQIRATIFPLVYPYPESVQYFKPYFATNKASSVFFVCSK